MAKAFEKQIKTIEDQGEKQSEALENLKPKGQTKSIEGIKKYAYSDKDSPLISKQKEIFSELVDKKLEKTTELDKKVNSDNLIYRYKGRTAGTKFDKFDKALDLIDKKREGKISLTDVKIIR